MAKVLKATDIIIRKTSVCTAGSKVLEMLDGLNQETGEFLKIKSVIGAAKTNGMWPVYVDEEEKENLYGLIKKGAVEDSYIEELLENDSYQIQISSHNGNEISGKLLELVIEGAATEKTNAELSGDIKALVDQIVEKGIETREQMDQRVEYMRQNKVDELLMTRILKGYRKYNRPTRNPSCLYQDPYLDPKSKAESIVSEGLRAAASRFAVIAEGDKSVGKNVYLETLAWLMGMPLYLITFSRQMSPSSIYGEKTTDPSAAKELAAFDSKILADADRVEEKIRFSMNLLYKAGLKADEAMDSAMNSLSKEDKETLEQAARFKKLQAQSASVNIVIDASELYDWLADGGLMVWNELNMADSNFLASFANQLLDGTGFIFIPGRGDVKIHKDCVLFGTQNADYLGTEQQNEATLSRFGCIVFEQPESIKKQIVAATEAAIKKGDSPEAKLADKYYDECQNFYAQCMKSTHAGAVSNACLNIRGFVRALTTVAESNGHARLKRQLQIHVINTCPTDDRMALSSFLETCVTL